MRIKVLEIQSYTPSRRRCWCKVEIAGQTKRLKMWTEEAEKFYVERDKIDESDAMIQKFSKISWWDRVRYFLKVKFRSKNRAI